MIIFDMIIFSMINSFPNHSTKYLRYDEPKAKLTTHSATYSLNYLPTPSRSNQVVMYRVIKHMNSYLVDLKASFRLTILPLSVVSFTNLLLIELTNRPQL